MDFVRMPTTMWTQISHARRRGGTALDTLLAKYRTPVLAFVRNLGLHADEAEDLTQDIFLRIFSEGVLEKADRMAGRFRSLLLSVARHTVMRWKRDQNRIKRGGGRRKLVAQDEEDGLQIDKLLAAPVQEDQAFDPLWVQNLIRLAMDRLKRECERTGMAYYRALMLYTGQGKVYSDIAKELGVSLQDVKNYLHKARLRLKEFVCDEIREYSSTPDEYDTEVRYLTKFLS